VTHPAHPLGGPLGVVAVFLRHPADTAVGTELTHSAIDYLGDKLGSGHVRPLERRNEQRGTPANTIVAGSGILSHIHQSPLPRS